MEKVNLKGKVQTVLGLIEANNLGVILPHEHLFVDGKIWFIEPGEPDEKELARQPVSLENLSWVRSNRMSNLDNLHLTSEEVAINEVMHFKKAKGNTIVDLTPNNLRRNPSALVHVAQATGINVIMGTAYYVEPSYHSEMHMDSRTEEDIADEFTQDVMVGVGDSGVRAGVIGEIGCSWPLTNNERKVLHAAAISQQATGAAISVHPGPNEGAPIEIVKVLASAGADLNHTIICHMSRTIAFHDTRCELAEKGCYLEWDMFGNDGFYPPSEVTLVDVPSDAGRIRQIIQLIEEGYLKQILISHDVWNKAMLRCLGGGGYSHILTTVIPFMKQKGITEKQIRSLVIENPREVLRFT
ncbi:MAG: hypothetical protein KAX30_00110 [Candidatus Atribacteria bacterium]|nr:hypothetical protein [Candidatus Atribacteria bacterium]